MAPALQITISDYASLFMCGQFEALRFNNGKNNINFLYGNNEIVKTIQAKMNLIR